MVNCLWQGLTKAALTHTTYVILFSVKCGIMLQMRVCLLMREETISLSLKTAFVKPTILQKKHISV